MSGDQAFKFYTEDDYVPQRWHLIEAVWWIAVSRIPYHGERESFLESPSNYKDREFRSPFLTRSNIMALEREYTDEIGVSPSPFIDNPFDHLDQIDEKILDLRHLISETAPRWNRDLKTELTALEDFVIECSEWTTQHNMKLDESVIKLFNSLKEGHLIAFGYKIPAENTHAVSGSMKSRSLRFREMQRQKIAPEEWSLKGFGWDNSTLECNHFVYAGIIVIRDHLLSKFSPVCQKIDNGGHCDGLIISSEKENFVFADDARDKAKSGRPAKDWDAFHLEIAKRLDASALPSKQTAAAYEMRDWFKTELDAEVGLSTLAEKLAPYWRAGLVKR